MTDFRIGHGYDAHRFCEGRPLVLGGITVPHEKGLLGHSDADVLLHAIMDAMLGAAALGDIGHHFPDTDDTYKGANSLQLFSKTIRLLKQSGFVVHNVDATVIAQEPKLAPYMEDMHRTIAKVLNLPLNHVSIKATTTERMGFEGHCEGISCHAVCLIKNLD